MAKKVFITHGKVKKEPGYLYFVDKDGDISRAKMAAAARRKGDARRRSRPPTSVICWPLLRQCCLAEELFSPSMD